MWVSVVYLRAQTEDTPVQFELLYDGTRYEILLFREHEISWFDYIGHVPRHLNSWIANYMQMKLNDFIVLQIQEI